MNDRDWTRLIEAGDDPEQGPDPAFVDGLEERLRGMTSAQYGGAARRTPEQPAMKSFMIKGTIAASLLAVVCAAGYGAWKLAKPRPKPKPVEEVAEGSGSGPGPMRVDPRLLEMVRKQRERQAKGSAAEQQPEEREKLNARMAYFASTSRGPKWLGSSIKQGTIARFVSWESDARKDRVVAHLGEGDAAHGEDGIKQLFMEQPVRPVAVVGHVDDREASKLLKMYHHAGVLMFPLAAGTEALIHDSQVYCVNYDEKYYAHVITTLLRKMNMRRISIVSDGSLHGGRLTDAIVARMQAAGMQIDMVAALTSADELEEKVAKAAEIGHPKAIALVSRDPKKAAAMVNALAKTKSELPVILTDGGAGLAFLENVKRTRFPVLVATSFDPTAERAKTFVTAYKAKFGVMPDQWAALAYDVAGMFFASIDAGAEVYDVTHFERYIRGRLTEKNPYVGVTGDLHFDVNGRAYARDVHLLLVKDGKYQRHNERLMIDERKEIEEAPPVQLTEVDPRRGQPDVGAGSGMQPRPDPGGMQPTRGANRPRRMVWNQTIEDALDQAEELDKPILVDFYSKSCMPCLKMEKTTWQSAAFKTAAADWVLLRIDLDQHPAYSMSYRLKDLPAIGFWTERGCVAATVTPGYQSGEQMAVLMKKYLPKVREIVELEDQLLAPTHKAATMDDPKVFEAVAGFYFEKQNWGEAASFYQTAFHMYRTAKKEAQARGLYMRLCRAQIKAVDIDGARRTAKEWVEKYPKSEGLEYALYVWGYCELRDKKLDSARKRFAELARRFGEQHERYQQAVKVFERYAGEPLKK